MKKIAYSILYILSLLLIPIMLLNLNIYKKDSPNYYINNFKDNKDYFEKLVDLKISMSDENGISEEYNECKSQLFKLCRVDSIDILLDDKNSISVAFYMSDASYYPSTENKYRMILYQPNDEIPDHFKRNFNRKITSNWFFITNDNQYVWNALIIISIILFDLFVWVFGIVKFIKYNLIHGIRND